jgi:regulator of nucleoside diphosphate kinase
MQTLPIRPDAKLAGPIIVTEFDKRRLLGLIEIFRARSTDPDSLDELELELERADTVDPWNVPADVVTMNSTVELVDLDTSDRRTLTVVFPGAADATSGRVSILAPVGLALLGARQGAQIECPTPSGTRRVVVERISFQPEASGKYHL